MAKRVWSLFPHTWHPTEVTAPDLRVAFRALGYRLRSTLRAVRRVAYGPRLGASVYYVTIQADLCSVVLEFGITVVLVHGSF
jgi:hypothetical protein